MMKRFLIAALCALIAFPAPAQQLAPGTMMGNSRATAGPPRQETVSALLDRALGALDGRIVCRQAGAWEDCTAPVIGSAGATGTLGLAGTTSGTVTIAPQAAAGTYNFNLPTGAGTAGQPLLSGGGGAAAMTFGTLGLTHGGTNASLTANNGGVVYSDATGLAILNNPGGSGRTVLSQNAAAPIWSTTAYPGSAGTGTILNAQSTNNITATRTAIIGAAGNATGTIGFSGVTSGTVTVQPQSVAGTYNFNLPTSAGTAGHALLSGGGGATAMTFGLLSPAAGGTGSNTTATSDRYLKGNGTNWITSTGAASGIGSCGGGQFVTGLNSDAAPSCGTPAGAGTVTSVGFTAGSGITITGTNPITTSGTATFEFANTVATGGTGQSNLIYLMSGLQPHKLVNPYEIAVNPGFWSNYDGTKTNKTTSVLQANLNTATCDFTVTPALGCMTSGAMDAVGTNTDATEVWLYLIERVSDRKPMLIGSSSDTFGSSQTFTATATTPGVITTPVAHGLRRRMTVRVSNSGGSLPNPLGAGIDYFVCTVPSATTFTVTTSIANVNSGSCLAFTTTGSGTNTVVNGVVNELTVRFGAGVAEVSRAIQNLTFIWHSAWGWIPDFSLPPNSGEVLVTNVTSQWRILNAGTAAVTTAVDLSPWLSNGNRRVRLLTSCASSGSGGLCLMKSPGMTNIIVGSSPAPGQVDTNIIELGTDSTTRIEYLVTGGANLTAHVLGWTQMEQR